MSLTLYGIGNCDTLLEFGFSESRYRALLG